MYQVTDSTAEQGIRRFVGRQGLPPSRTDLRTANRLGVIRGEEQRSKAKLYRKHELELYDRYFERTQYNHLKPWDECTPDLHVPIRQRNPRINYPYAKILCQRVAAKLIGAKSFPKLVSQDDPMWQEYLQAMVTGTSLQSQLRDPIQRLLNTGSVFVKFYVRGGRFVFKWYPSKWCYPVFLDDGDQLQSIRIQYVFSDNDDLDPNGKPKRKWFRMDMDQVKDVEYDTPEFRDHVEPEFQAVSETVHNLGFVMGEWMKTGTSGEDGSSLIADCLDFIDELNYSLSQSSHAVSYNQDPQLVIKNMTEDELEDLVRSSMKSWNLGKEGDASFLESTLNGVQVAKDLRDVVRLNLSDITRMIMHDPEKMVASAQSGKALEILFAPLVELIEEIRPLIQPALTSLVTKLALVNYQLASIGAPATVNIPPGWRPTTLDFRLEWPEVFPMTIEDIQKKASLIISLTSATVISRETGLELIAKELGITDLELEKQRIAAQPIINPFGAF